MTIERRLKQLDIFKIIPESFKEASVTGICFSFLFILLTMVLLINELVYFVQPTISSEMMVDHMKDDKDLTVNLEVEFPKYPCAMLSLDKMDVLHSHIMNVQEKLVKTRIKPGTDYAETQVTTDGLGFNEKFKMIQEQVENKEGCLLKGSFTIKMVPGNFHISFHAYGAEFQNLLAKQIYIPDMSHHVKQLSFGDVDQDKQNEIISDFRLKTLHTLNDTKHENLKDRLGFPHGVVNNIRIIPSRFEYDDEEDIYELYQYTATSKGVVSRQVAVYFMFEIENFYMYFRRSENSFSHFLIQTMSILGGFYTLMLISKMFIEDGVMGAVFKKRIGKLE